MDRCGILVNYDFCCGCHTCEIACQKDHGYADGIFGVKVAQVGPFGIEGSKKKVFDFCPVLTDLCDLCAKRTAKGKEPTCVKHCQTGCLRYGAVEELVKFIFAEKKYAILSPR